MSTGNEQRIDAAGMEARMDSIRLKQILGVAVTNQELMCLQIEQNGLGCPSSDYGSRIRDLGTSP
jgi:hypothetical protein